MNAFPPAEVLRTIAERSNECCNWGDKLYSRWEETTEFIVLTPKRYWQT